MPTMSVRKLMTSSVCFTQKENDKSWMQSFDHNTHGWFKTENIDDLLGLFLCCGVKLNKNKEELERKSGWKLSSWSFDHL